MECDTLSQLNNHCDPDCASTGTRKTGTTPVACFQYLRRHRPQFFFVENVRTLASESKASSSCRTQQSNNPLQLITEWANDLGYVIFSQLLDSCHYGVPQHRPRYYVFGFVVGNERSEPGT
ncbi:MAG: DNA cytosine methyltransferase, partial [Candidatus Fonsibacter sp.]